MARRSFVPFLLLALAGCSDDPPLALDASLPPADVTADVAHPDAAADVTPPSDVAPSAPLRIIVGPDDRGASLLAAIAAAQRSVHLTMYLLSSRDVLDALLAARARGVEVQVVLNRTIPGGMAVNMPAYDALTAAGVEVHWAPSGFTFTHEKCVILDGTEAWIMTMNATAAGLTTNREFLAVDRDPSDVRDAEAIFRADFAGTPLPTYAGRLLLSPVNAQRTMVSLVLSATRTIDIEAESFEDRMTAAAIITRVRAGVAVRLVLPDATPSASSMRSIMDVIAAGVRVVRVRAPYIHSKAVVVDGARAYVGSANLTYVSLTANRELGVVFDVPSEVRRVADVIAQDFAVGVAF
jgi:phosphatidylserine/phosphatidylglycerophosphate/cardiolipin synthase-like enzyme